jgi:hypothetical protein
MATLIPVAVNPTGPGFTQATSADTVSIPGSISISGGIALPTFTQGSVIFAGAAGLLSQDNANFFWDDTNNSLGVGTAAPGTTNLVVVQPVRTSLSPSAVKITGGAHTGLATNVEASDVYFNLARTVTFATGAWAGPQRAVKIEAPTYTVTGGSTITDVATVGITGAPARTAAGVFTNTHALLISAGAVGTTGGAAYGLTVNAPTGATTNYAAQFLGNNPVDVPLVVVQNNNDNVDYTQGIHCMVPNYVGDSKHFTGLAVGTSFSARNTGTIGFFSAGAGLTTNYMYFGGHSVDDAMVLTMAGRVGIGLVAPEFQLHVNGAGSATIAGGLALFRGTNATTNVSAIVIEKVTVASLMIGVNKNSASGSVPSNCCFISTWATTQPLCIGRGGSSDLPSTADIYIDTAGRIGIGTTSPNVLLEIKGTTDQPVRLWNTSATGYTGIDLWNDAGARKGYLSGGGTAAAVWTQNNIYLGTDAGNANGKVHLAIKDDPKLTVNSDGTVGIGTTGPTAQFHVVQTVSISGSPTAMLMVGGAHTGLTAATEASDIYFNLARTVQFTTGADITMQRAVRIAAPTYAMTAATSTITEAATLCVSGGPVEGANCDLKSSYGILVQGGAVGTCDSGYGIRVIAPTGATNNYAAWFSGGNVGFGLTSTSTYVNISEPTRTTGSPSAFVVRTSAHTTLTAATEAKGVYFDFTGDVEFTDGAPITLQRAFAIQGPSYKFTAPSTITDTATMALTGAPIAKNGATTITRTHGILVSAVDVTSGGVGVVDASYGAYINSMTGATNNYGAKIIGGSGTAAAVLVVEQTVATTGAVMGFAYTGAANTGQAAATEIKSVLITTASRQWTAGAAITMQREVHITQPTYSFTAGSTIDVAASFAISGAPKSGANATITATHGILVQAGDVSGGVSVPASYGLTVYAQTGATANYAAQFLGGATAGVVVNPGTTPAIAILLDMATIGGGGATLRDSHVIGLKSQSRTGGGTDHYGMIYIDAYAWGLDGDAGFRVRCDTDSTTLASANDLLVVSYMIGTAGSVIFGDGANPDDLWSIAPATKTGGGYAGDPLSVHGGDTYTGSGKAGGHIYIDGGVGDATPGQIAIGTLIASEVINIGIASSQLAFFAGGPAAVQHVPAVADLDDLQAALVAYGLLIADL